MKRQVKKMIKFYEYHLGNNRLVGNDALGGYSEEVPRWYKLQAEVYDSLKHHQLAGEEEKEEAQEGGGTFWQADDYEAGERLAEGDWDKYVAEHDIFLPSQAQSDIESLKKQGLL